MDTERLGRVLGVGARHAAKTLVGAVDAASAPHPSASNGARPVPGAGRGDAGRANDAAVSAPRIERPAAARAEILSPAQGVQGGGRRGGAPRGVVEGGRRFGRAIWEPAARLSGVLWLEVTGLFFGIFVLVAATAAWRLRGAIRLAPNATNAQAHTELLMAVGMLVLFGYFAASSFLAANRRSRRR